MTTQTNNILLIAVCLLVPMTSGLRLVQEPITLAFNERTDDFRPSPDADDVELQRFLEAYQKLHETGLMPKPIPYDDFNKTIRFLHIPKTGTSFFNAVVKRACPRLPSKMMQRCLADFNFFNKNAKYLGSEYCDVNVLVPAHAPMEEVNVRRAVGMFRSAVNITASKYFFDLNGLRKDGRDKVKQSSSPLLTFVSFPQVISTQTKILSGSDAHEPLTPSQADLRLAIDRLVLMKFVGLTDQWVISVFLFSAMFGGHVPALIDFGNVRSTKYDDNGYEDAVQQLRSRDFDPYDEEIFAVATDLFTKRVQLWFGPACAKAMSSTSNPLCDFMKGRKFLTW